MLWRAQRRIVRLEDKSQTVAAVENLHQRALAVVASMLDARDLPANRQLSRVADYAAEIGQRKGLSERELEALRVAALLHDIGRLAVPEYILSKPGKLTREEFERVKKHPEVGAQILEMMGYPRETAEIVRAHHEKWNGEGYPKGIKGEAIPAGARVLAAADALDAMISDQEYRPAMPFPEAIQRIAAESGTSFDPKVVALLVRHSKELERMAVEPAMTSPAIGAVRTARKETQQLFEMGQELGNSLNLDATLSLLAMRLKRLIPYDSIVIYVRHDEVLRPEFAGGDQFRELSARPVGLGQGLAGWVSQHRRPILNGDPSQEPNSPGTTPIALRSALVVSLEMLKHPVGVVALLRRDKDAFTPDDLQLLAAVAPKAAAALDNSLRYRHAESSATTDHLTGLMNARSLFLYLEGEMARCQRLDADRLKREHRRRRRRAGPCGRIGGLGGSCGSLRNGDADGEDASHEERGTYGDEPFRHFGCHHAFGETGPVYSATNA